MTQVGFFIPVIAALTIVIILIARISRGNMTSSLLKRQMNMMEDLTSGDMKDTLQEMSKKAIDIRKEMLERNEDSLKDIANMEANIEKEAIKTKARAAKEGFSADTMYCKHCGVSIDADSKFCKACGNKQ